MLRLNKPSKICECIFNTENRLDFFRVTFEFIEKVRKTFAEADTDNTGYLDVSEFTAFMRRTYPDISNREAQIIFMKVCRVILYKVLNNFFEILDR